MGLVQDAVINFAGAGKTMSPLPGLWSSQYPDAVSALGAFANDYGNAVKAAAQTDAMVQSDSEAAATGQDYATITTLAYRQAFGALQLAGTAAQPYLFLKEISSDGDTSTVDVVFPTMPALLYANPTLVRLLLDPLFENQERGPYPNKYAEHDLGGFPNAGGYPGGNDEAMPLEECGNMIIMALAYAQRSGDTAYLKTHYPKLSQWATFLSDESLIPANQLSTDDFAGLLAYVPCPSSSCGGPQGREKMLLRP